MRKIRIGSRKSPLALWQAKHVQLLLEAGGAETELVLMETKGDKVLEVSISKIGSKGVFTEELEEKLANGSIDVAVHSAKDLASRLPPGFEILSFTTREGVQDVIVSDGAIDLDTPVTLGTSSTRRIATLKHFHPHVKTVDVRGNLQTRIEKMRSGLCDGLLLAYAGVYRMGFGHMIQHSLSLDTFIPAVGQGSLALECHSSLDSEAKSYIRNQTNDVQAERQLLAERAYLRELEGGCSIPVFANCELANGALILRGGIISLDGSRRVEKLVTGANPVDLGVRLSKEVLSAGGKEILEEIKNTL